MIKWIERWKRKFSPAQEITQKDDPIDWIKRTTDLECRIESLGRRKVFDRARIHGWGPGSAPPIWVLEAICWEIETGRNFSAPAPRLINQQAG